MDARHQTTPPLFHSLTAGDLDAIVASLEVAADATGDTDDSEVYPGVRAALEKMRAIRTARTDVEMPQTVGAMITHLSQFPMGAKIVLDVDLADCHSDRNVFTVGSIIYDEVGPGDRWVFINNGADA